MSENMQGKEPRKFYFVKSDLGFSESGDTATLTLAVNAVKMELDKEHWDADFPIRITIESLKWQDGWGDPYIKRVELSTNGIWQMRGVVDAFDVVGRRVSEIENPREMFIALMRSPLFVEVCKDWRDSVYRRVTDAMPEGFKLYDVIGVKPDDSGEKAEYKIVSIFASSIQECSKFVSSWLVNNGDFETIKNWMQNGNRIVEAEIAWVKKDYWNVPFLDKLAMISPVPPLPEPEPEKPMREQPKDDNKQDDRAKSDSQSKTAEKQADAEKDKVR